MGRTKLSKPPFCRNLVLVSCVPLEPDDCRIHFFGSHSLRLQWRLARIQRRICICNQEMSAKRPHTNLSISIKSSGSTRQGPQRWGLKDEHTFFSKRFLNSPRGHPCTKFVFPGFRREGTNFRWGQSPDPRKLIFVLFFLPDTTLLYLQFVSTWRQRCPSVELFANLALPFLFAFFT